MTTIDFSLPQLPEPEQVQLAIRFLKSLSPLPWTLDEGTLMTLDEATQALLHEVSLIAVVKAADALGYSIALRTSPNAALTFDLKDIAAHLADKEGAAR